MTNKITDIPIIWFAIGYTGTYIFGSKQKEHEGRFVSNLIIVQNTSTCNNICYHIHHWMWMLLVVLFIVCINKFIIVNNYPVNYTNLIALYLGASISEYMKYGNDIFIIKQKCFSDCLLERYNK